MSSTYEIDIKISEYAKKLSDLPNEESNKRIKKRILQALGKLKKQKLSMTGSSIVADSLTTNGNDSDDDSGGGCGDVNNVNDVDVNDVHYIKKMKLNNTQSSALLDCAATMTELQTFNRKKLKAKVKLLNKELAELAQKKQLKLAKKRFKWGISKGYSDVYDVHTYTNLINCYVRCNDMNGARLLFDTMNDGLTNHIVPNVVTYTTMMKGYCEIGDMHIAKDLLYSKATFGNAWTPNTRAINTFLRGCVRSGKVDYAKDAFSYFFESASSQPLGDAEVLPDAASYEYFIILLCQSLQLDTAEQYCHSATIQIRMNDVTDDNSLLSLLSMYLHIAVAYAVTGSRDNCIKYLEICDATMEQTKNNRLHNNMLKKVKNNKQRVCEGNGDDANISNSLRLFQQHRRQEMELELDLIHGYANSSRSLSPAEALSLYCSKLKRVYYVDTSAPASATIIGSSADSKSNTVNSIVSSLKGCYGLNNLFNMMKAHSSSDTKAVREDTISDIVSSIDDAGCIDFTGGSAKGKHTVKMEIGSGNGEWLVAQASHDVECVWLGLELRCDRIHKTFLCNLVDGNPNANLTLLGGDASRILPTMIRSGTIASIFINHPEPPERSTGEGDSQGAHLLTQSFFDEMHRILVDVMGTVTIVTDNLPYATSLMTSIITHAKMNRRATFVSVSMSKDSAEADDRVLESREKFDVDPGEKSATATATVNGVIEIWRGTAGTEAGHVVDSGSYFDRLWTNGKKKRRWFLCLRKV